MLLERNRACHRWPPTAQAVAASAQATSLAGVPRVWAAHLAKNRQPIGVGVRIAMRVSTVMDRRACRVQQDRCRRTINLAAGSVSSMATTCTVATVSRALLAARGASQWRIGVRAWRVRRLAWRTCHQRAHSALSVGLGRSQTLSALRVSAVSNRAIRTSTVIRAKPACVACLAQSPVCSARAVSHVLGSTQLTGDNA